MLRYCAVPILLVAALFVASLFQVHQVEASTLVTYQRSDEMFVNPERGFYGFTDAMVPAPGAGMTGNLSLPILKSYRMFPDGYSLIIRLYNLHGFRDMDLTQDALDFIQTDFDLLREAGLKAILQFRYSTAIGTPDAPLEVVLRHIDQLTPLLQENYDVIAIMKAGFIGAWGEWHATTNNLLTTENKRTILFKLLDALPKERMVQLRYPSDKMFIYETDQPLDSARAHDGSRFARTAHHNDCFLASETDVGTYRISVSSEKQYLTQDTRYVAMGGETCRVREGERYKSETALKEMAQLHWSFLNSRYYLGTLNTWREEGTMDEVVKRLGYRFALIQGEYSASAPRQGTMTMDLTLINEGFAAPFNPRGVELIARNKADGSVFAAALPVDPRFWLPQEEVQIKTSITISPEMSPGEYELMLHLPDPAERLYGRPEYSIRLANADVWEASTGFNRLGATLTVLDESAAPESASVAFEAYQPYAGN